MARRDGSWSAWGAGVPLSGAKAPLGLRATVIAALAATLWLGGCGGDDQPGSGRADRPLGGSASDETEPGSGRVTAATTVPSETKTTAAGGEERTRITRAVHRYVDSIDASDGAALCALLAPGALRGVELPLRRPSCASSLRASIGYPSPGGSPRWLRTTLVDADSVVTIDGGLGRFTGTVVHRFAGSREPSIEDDVIYLRRIGGRWKIAKPSATFYRAIGARDVPIAALRAP